MKDLLQSNTVIGQMRLQAIATSGSGVWLTTISCPTKTIPKDLNIRMEMEIFGLGKAYNFCVEILDAYGHHILGYMRQDSKYDIFNYLRIMIFRYISMDN